METSPPPVSLARARNLPWKPGRSAEVLVDSDLEVRFTPRPASGSRHTHDRDELYFIAAGHGFFAVGDKVSPVGTGDLCFAAAHEPHGFERFSEDFAIWIVFYGPKK